MKKLTSQFPGHLLDKKVGHWDASVRELTALAFKEMCSVAPAEIVDKVWPLVTHFRKKAITHRIFASSNIVEGLAEDSLY